METTNVNNNQGESVEGLKTMFADFQKKQTQTKKKSSAEILAKYFTPRNNKETFRLLPKNGHPLQEAFFHVVPTNIPGAKIKHNTIIYCPAHNDPKVPKLDASGNKVLDPNGNPIMVFQPCPLCAKYKKIIARQDASIKYKKKDAMSKAELVIKTSNDAIFKEATVWEAKKFYIVKGIDKGVEKDGVKFWRFKFNFKNQGTADKLMPILENFVEQHGVSFADPLKGCDLSITTADSEFMGRTYKQITAITAKNPSPLHADPIMVQAWLNDPITWRNVFLPRKAPNTTAYEYLAMIAEGNSPYWDDIDANNKHWVFPNNPELEALANTRTANLDDDEDTFEQASDILDGEYTPTVTVSNVRQSDVGTFKDNAVNMGAEALAETTPETTPEAESTETPDAPDNTEDYNDLPF